jgi:hypothetical protein
VDDGTGNAVGYILGTASTAEFVSAFRREYIPSLLNSETLSPPAADEDWKVDWENDPVGTLRRMLYNPERAMLHEGIPGLLEVWRTPRERREE